MDGHMALANSKALQLAGITEDTAEPEGGSFMRGKDGGKVVSKVILNDHNARVDLPIFK